MTSLPSLLNSPSRTGLSWTDRGSKRASKNDYGPFFCASLDRISLFTLRLVGTLGDDQPCIRFAIGYMHSRNCRNGGWFAGHEPGPFEIKNSRFLLSGPARGEGLETQRV